MTGSSFAGRLLLALGVFASPRVNAQPSAPATGYAFSSWNTADGLPQNHVRGIAQDRDGYLWIATLGTLSRFDGRRFLGIDLQSADDRIPDPIRALTTDRADDVWLLRYEAGVTRIGRDGPHASATAPLPRSPAWLAFGRADSIWMAGDNELWLHTAGRWQEERRARDLVGAIEALFVDAAGNVWLGGRRGMARLARGRVDRWRQADGLPSDTIRAFATGPGTGVWVGTERGLVGISGQGQVLPVESGADLHAPIDRIVLAASGRYWLAGRDGVRRVRIAFEGGGTVRASTRFFQRMELGGAHISSMHLDDAGRLWIGSDGAGLFQLRPLSIARIRQVDGLPSRPVHHIAGDGDDGLWIASGCGGLSHWRGGALRNLQRPAMGMRTDCIEALGRDRDRGLWIGERRWFSHVDSTGRVTRFDLGDAFEEAAVGPFLEDHRGAMWVASSTGQLGRVSPGGRLDFPLTIKGLPRTTISSLAEDEHGALWVGQVGTITRIVADSVERQLGAAEGVPAARIRALLPELGYGLWIATYGGGLARYEPGLGVRRLTSDDGLFDDALSAIVRDRADRLWFLGDHGLAVMPRSELLDALAERRPPREAVVFGPRDSMPEGNGGFTNAWLDENQRLWLATVDGVASVDVGGFPFDRTPARARIDDIRVDGRASVRLDRVAVPPGEHVVEITFSAPNLDATDRLRFRYRLVGHDPDWVESGAERTARYAQVRPGTYSFELLGRNVDGVEATTPVTVELRVHAAWWQLAWVRGLVAALLLVVAWRWLRWRLARAEERHRVLEREINERRRAQAAASRASSQLAHVSRVATAGELAASLAHELNQPLTAVMSNAQAARRMRGLGLDEELDPVLDDIVAQSERAAGVVKAMRDFVRKQTPEVAAIDPARLVLETLHLVHPELAARGVVARVEPGADSLSVAGDPVQLQQVLVNLVLNAADAVRDLEPQRRTVTVSTAADGSDFVRISVMDRGPGLTAAQRSHLFEPFYTTKPTGLGIGLPLSRSIVESHAGSLTITSMPDKGTVVNVRLPVWRQ